MASPVTLRRAVPEDWTLLTEIAIRAKASHGYDEAFMTRVLDDMVISPASIARDTVMLALSGRRILGFAHLMPIDRSDTVYLENLFITPEAHGAGIGRLLFEWAATEAAKRGYAWLEWDSDPNAAEFYRKMGAEQISETESAALPGRMIPKFRKHTDPRAADNG